VERFGSDISRADEIGRAHGAVFGAVRPVEADAFVIE
jgi:hypothetical protein